MVMQVQECFFDRFRCSPDHIASAPGRVNIIGEHIDYCGFSVLPCALDRCAYVAISKTDDNDMSVIHNVKSSEYPSGTLKIVDRFIELKQNSSLARNWCDYIICGAYAAVKYLMAGRRDDKDAELCLFREVIGGYRIVMHSDIPPGAGLSSSSALVVASCLAILTYSLSPDMSLVAQSCTDAERLIGTMGGGMDQAVCCLGQLNHALHVHFVPHLSARPIPLPSGISFVICDSRVVAEKAQGARDAFNTRVCECRVAALLLGKHLRLGTTSTLREVFDGYKTMQDAVLDDIGVLQNLALISEQVFQSTSYTFADVRSQLSMEEWSSVCSHEQLLLLERSTALNLRQRTMHVLKEAARVLQFCDTCCTTNWSSHANAQISLDRLGAALSTSHNSLKELYDCSCEELNTLVQCCRDGGALGARLTGAGWGGCVVAMIYTNDREDFVKHLGSSYYVPRGVELNVVDRFVFVATASKGAAIVYK